MFKSKQRPIVVPQWEHQKLAGTLALLWGNTEFERPPVAFESFVTGVGLHDRAYGMLDNLPIGEFPEDQWQALTQRGFETTWSDTVADSIAKMHLARLVSYGDAPARQAQARSMREAIHRLVREHGLDYALFERIDRITNLCDQVAFDFCFEAPASGKVQIFPKNDYDKQVEVSYTIDGSIITLDPWPLSGEHHTGYLVGYQLEGYPERLEPVLLPYQLRRSIL